MPETDVPVRYPLSAQLTMCCLNEASGFDMSLFVMVSALRITGQVDSAALRGALDDLAVRHESLRTVLSCECANEGEGYQTVLPPASVPFTEHDITPRPGAPREDLAEKLLVDLHTETMPRSRPPLIRAALHRFDDADSVLTLVVHHTAGDAWSANLLRRDLAALYRARTTGIAPGLPPVRQYGEYAREQQDWLAGTKAAQTRTFWSDRLTGRRVFTLPADHVDGGSGPPRAINFTIGPDEMAAVRGLARSVRGTAWHVLVAAGALLTSRIGGTTEVGLITNTAARTDSTYHDSVGFFSDVLPLLVDLAGCVTYRDVVLRARGCCLAAFSHPVPNRVLEQDTPDFMQSNREPENVPFFFNYVRPILAASEIQFADGVEPVTMRDRPAQYRNGWCIWNLAEVGSGEVVGLVEYSAGRLDPSTAEGWVAEFRDLVRRIVESPDQAREDD